MLRLARRLNSMVRTAGGRGGSRAAHFASVESRPDYVMGLSIRSKQSGGVYDRDVTPMPDIIPSVFAAKDEPTKSWVPAPLVPEVDTDFSGQRMALLAGLPADPIA